MPPEASRPPSSPFPKLPSSPRAATALLVALLLGFAGCGESRPPAMLAEDNVLVVTPDPLWSTVATVLDDSLGVRPFGLPTENPFRLTQRDPEGVTTSDLQRYRQVLIVGEAQLPLVADALGEAAAGTALPALSTSRDAWVAGQQLVVLALPGGAGEEVLRTTLGEVARILHAGLHRWTVERMYSSGTHPEVDSVAAAAGFGLDVPGFFGWSMVADSMLMVASRPNDMDPLLRSVLVTWRPLGEEEATAEMALDWRDVVAPQAYEGGQTTRREPIEVSEVEGTEARGLQVRGFWSAIVEGQLQGGSTITRVIDCPDQGRRYLLDSWIYAPNRGKYRYLMQLEALLDTFRCSAG